MPTAIFWFCAFIIFYTYAGYPLILAFLAKLTKKEQNDLADSPSVSLIIAAYNEQDFIEKKLQNCLELNYLNNRYQVIIAADGSSDRTVEIAQQWIKSLPPTMQSNFVINHIPDRQGKMAAIKRAVPLANGEILVFSDANNLYQPQTLAELVAPFSDPNVGGVSGAKQIIQEGDALGQSEGLYWKYESQIKEWETRISSCTSASGEIIAIRKSLYEPPPSNIINDDFFMAMMIIRKGARFVYAPSAKSFETVSKTANDEILRRERIVAGRYQAIALAPRILPWKYPLVVWQVFSHKFIRPFLPFAMIGLLVTNVWITIFPDNGIGSGYTLSKPVSTIFLLLQCVFYLLAWIGTHFTNSGKIGKLLYIPTFLVNSNYAALSGALRYFRRQQTTNWTRVQRRT